MVSLVSRGEWVGYEKLKWSRYSLFQLAMFGNYSREICLEFGDCASWSCLTWMWSFMRIKVWELVTQEKN